MPPETTYWSPYSGLDGLCGNTLLIPLEELSELGLLEPEELPPPQSVQRHADFTAVAAVKLPLLDKAATRLCSDPGFEGLRAEVQAFRAANAWVEQSALFSILTTLPGLAGEAWWDWPSEFRDRDPATLATVRAEHAEEINTFIALQFLFDKFWKAVRVRWGWIPAMWLVRKRVLHFLFFEGLRRQSARLGGRLQPPLGWWWRWRGGGAGLETLAGRKPHWAGPWW